MKLSLWLPAPSRKITTPRLITGGVSLVLAVLTLIASALFVRPAAAAPRQSQVALTPRLEVVTTVGGQAMHKWSTDNGTTWSALGTLGAQGDLSFTSATAISDQSGRIDYFARDSSGGFQWKTSIDDQTSSWNLLPGVVSVANLADRVAVNWR
jgi:hypothetical protein